MVNCVLAHDLLWGLTPAQLPVEAPHWAVEAMALGQPVVVRRASCAAGQVAVGVRGVLREQRFATLMLIDAIERRVRPEDLCAVRSDRDVPALHALAHLRPMLDACGWVWGISGSAGFELASGCAALHERSDLDLILRAPQPLARTEAQALLLLLDAAPCPVDLQVQTPYGAIALREWARPARRVLLKNSEQACLVLDPWNPQEQAA